MKEFSTSLFSLLQFKESSIQLRNLTFTTNPLNNSINLSLSRNSVSHSSQEVTSSSDVSFVVLNAFNCSGEQVSSLNLVAQYGCISIDSTVNNVQRDGRSGKVTGFEFGDVVRLAFCIGSATESSLVDRINHVTDGVVVDFAIQRGGFVRGGKSINHALQTLSFYLLRPVLTAGEVCRALIERDVEFLYGFKLISDSHVNLLGY